MAHRRDGEDTVDVAMHLLQKWQAEGWGVARADSQVDYTRLGKHRVPTKVTLTVELVPLKG